MAHLEGRKCFITLAGSLLEGVMDSNFATAVEYVDATTNDSDGHREGLADEDSASGSMSGRVNKAHTYGITQARAAQATKAAVALVWGPGVDIAGERVLSCDVIITNVEETAAMKDTINYTISWESTAGTSEGTSSTTKT